MCACVPSIVHCQAASCQYSRATPPPRGARGCACACALCVDPGLVDGMEMVPRTDRHLAGMVRGPEGWRVKSDGREKSCGKVKSDGKVKSGGRVKLDGRKESYGEGKSDGMVEFDGKVHFNGRVKPDGRMEPDGSSGTCGAARKDTKAKHGKSGHAACGCPWKHRCRYVCPASRPPPLLCLLMWTLGPTARYTHPYTSNCVPFCAPTP
eukprot:359639-Chlamydomonas_euryale.AAC.4